MELIVSKKWHRYHNLNYDSWSILTTQRNIAPLPWPWVMTKGNGEQAQDSSTFVYVTILSSLQSGSVRDSME
jgi:hypothetical protein